MSVADCLQQAGITLRDQIEMFDLPVDRSLSDTRIKEELKLMGYNPELLTPEGISEANVSLRQKFYAEQRQAKAQLSAKNFIDNYPGKPEAALASMVTNDINEVSGTVGAEKSMMSIVNLTHAKIHEFLSAMAPTARSTFMGLFSGKASNKQQRQVMDDVVDEIMGTNTNNPDAAKFAKSLTSALDDLNNRYAKLTGAVKKLKDWGLPQRHDAVKVGKASFDEWFAFTKSRLDMPRMIKENPDLGDPEAFKFAMQKVYNNISTDGLAKIDTRPFKPGNKGQIEPTRVSSRLMQTISNKHQASRFLQFKDGKSWREYQSNFGSDSVYQTITDHIMAVSREIALMERFGPDHRAGFEYAKSVAQQKSGDATSTKLAQSYYETLSNLAFDRPTKTAQLLKSIRDWNVATKLGGAILSAQSDHSFSAQTALYNGLSVTRMMNKYIQQLASTGARKEASRVAMTAEFALDRLSAAFEYQNAMATGKAKTVADLVMKVSGMEAHTVAMRQAFGMEFLQAMGEAGKKSFKDLPENMRKAFTRYGIDEAAWDKIRKAPQADFRGTKMIDPQAIDDPQVQQTLVGMILTETDFAVVTPGIRERSMVNIGTKAGSVGGEVVRSLTQFMSFPVTVQMKHMMGRGIMNKSASVYSKMGYMASVAVTSTILGGLVVQAKQVAKGKDPIDMDTGDFWVRAADQGGYFGLVGGFLLDTQGYYQGYSGGPVIDGPIKDLAYTLVAGNIDKIRNGKDTTFSKDATNFVIKNLPGNNIWYVRLALDRMIFDELRSRTDPDYRKRMNERMRRDRREYGQEHWWRPNESKPEFAR